MRRRIELLGVVLAAACADLNTAPTPSPPVASTLDVALAVGEGAQVDAMMRVAFGGVPADSRCPMTAMCIWGGDGAVAILHGLGTGPWYPDTLHTMLGPRSLIVQGGYRITLLDLAPYPSSLDPIPADAYVARLRVERLMIDRAP